jgi:hypothetical protein
MGNRRGNYGVHEMIETLFVLWFITNDTAKSLGEYHTKEACMAEKKAASKSSRAFTGDYKCIRTERQK